MFAPPRNAVAFLTSFSARRKYGAGNFAVCGRRPWVIPHSVGKCPEGTKGTGSWSLPLDPTSIFEKLLDQKTFIDLFFRQTAFFYLQKIIPIKYRFMPRMASFPAAQTLRFSARVTLLYEYHNLRQTERKAPADQLSAVRSLLSYL